MSVRLEDLYESSQNLIKEKEVVEGTVISIGKKEVVVNIGYKSEGVIGASNSTTLNSRPETKFLCSSRSRKTPTINL